MATGLGKTVVMAALCEQWQRGRVLALVHREELAFQFVQKVESYTGHRVDVEMSDWHADQCSLYKRAPVVVASVPTMIAKRRGQHRMEKFDPNDFGLILTDECHHVMAKSWLRILDYFATDNPSIAHVGFTATADRGDKQTLGRVFGSMATNRQIDWGIEYGWLVPLKQKIVHLDTLDLSRISGRQDLAAEELHQVMNIEGNLHGVATHTLNTMGRRQTLVYCAGVKQAHRLAELFCRYTGSEIARAVDGSTEKDERRKSVADFAAGRYQILCNCGVFTEGYDNPHVRLIVNARPTKRRGLYTQIVGRGTRPLPGIVDDAGGWALRDYQARDVAEILRTVGHPTNDTMRLLVQPEHRRAAIAASEKPDCVVLDFTGVAGRHQLTTTVDLLGGHYSDEVRKHAKTLPPRDEPLEPEQLLEIAKQDLLDKERRKRAKLQEWERIRLRETEVANQRKGGRIYRPTRADAASPKQIALLKRFGFDDEELAGLTRGQAGRMIGQRIGYWKARKR